MLESKMCGFADLAIRTLSLQAYFMHAKLPSFEFRFNWKWRRNLVAERSITV